MDKGKQPKRIQRKRTKGWRMPENTIYVGRPSKWGNPYHWHQNGKKGATAEYMIWLIGSPRLNGYNQSEREFILKNLHKLKGKNLACWCKEDEPCHADVLLKMANE